MNRAKLASAKCYLSWNSADASHIDWQYFPKVDFWRDIFPGDINEQFQDLDDGSHAESGINTGEVFPAKQAQALKHVRHKSVTTNFSTRHIPGPYIGRHYPKGLLAGCSGLGTIYPQDMTPFLLRNMDEKEVEVDLNHPLSDFELAIGVKIDELLPSKEERGGQCNDIASDIANNGSGLQCTTSQLSTELTNQASFSRKVDFEDRLFYQSPRMVQHIDSRARQTINQIYLEHIKPGMKILDLMSSWESHLNGIDDSVNVIGLGMNQEELQANPRLQSHDVWDLNQNPLLPYNDNEFDVVICTVSIEYVIHPDDVFKQIARILKPGGRFIVTFSDRWFPEKVIRVWTELHPYERMGLVLDYFRKSNAFTTLLTESWHGWLRPSDDKYFQQKLHSDPVFAVQGVKEINSSTWSSYL